MEGGFILQFLLFRITLIPLLVLEKVWKNSICLPLGITFRKGRILKRYRYNKAKQKAFLNINMNIEAQETQ